MRYIFPWSIGKGNQIYMWNVLFDKGVLTVAAVLAIIGSVLKYRTGTSNELICLIVSIAGIAVWTVCGIVMERDIGILSLLWEYGLKRGLLSAGFSVWIWDLMHGTVNYAKNKGKKE